MFLLGEYNKDRLVYFVELCTRRGKVTTFTSALARKIERNITVLDTVDSFYTLEPSNSELFGALDRVKTHVGSNCSDEALTIEKEMLLEFCRYHFELYKKKCTLSEVRDDKHIVEVLSRLFIIIKTYCGFPKGSQVLILNFKDKVDGWEELFSSRYFIHHRRLFRKAVNLNTGRTTANRTLITLEELGSILEYLENLFNHIKEKELSKV